MYPLQSAIGPGMVEGLPGLDNQIRELAIELRPEIESEIKETTSKEALCRAAYLGICLNLDEELSDEFPDQWLIAKDTFEECWKLKQLIYYNGSFPSIKRIREKFLTAGIEDPVNLLDLQIVWKEPRILLSANEAMELEIEDFID